MMISGQHVTYSVVRETAMAEQKYTPKALAFLILKRKNWSASMEAVLIEALQEAFMIMEMGEADGPHGKRG